MERLNTGNKKTISMLHSTKNPYPLTSSPKFGNSHQIPQSSTRTVSHTNYCTPKGNLIIPKKLLKRSRRNMTSIYGELEQSATFTKERTESILKEDKEKFEINFNSNINANYNTINALQNTHHRNNTVNITKSLGSTIDRNYIKITSKKENIPTELKFKPSSCRLVNSLFEKVISSDKTYGHLLRQIKDFYEREILQLSQQVINKNGKLKECKEIIDKFKEMEMEIENQKNFITSQKEIIKNLKSRIEKEKQIGRAHV